MSSLGSRFCRSRIALVSILLARIVYGVGLVVDPTRLTRRWLGPLSEPTVVALRGLGAREIVLHVMALVSALRGGPVRPFLAGSMAGDLADIVATTAARRGLPAGSAPATIVVAGASAAISAGVAAGADR
jgi:hypothetical protein